MLLIASADALKHMSSIIPWIQDQVLESREDVKTMAKDCSKELGFLTGTDQATVDLNKARYAMWRNGSAYLHHWSQGVSMHCMLTFRSRL